GGDDNMHVLGAAVDDVQVPAADGTMFGDDFLDKAALLRVEHARFFLQEGPGRGLKPRVRWPELSPFLDPTALIAGKPRTVGCPRQEVRQRVGHRDVPRIGTHRASEASVPVGLNSWPV